MSIFHADFQLKPYWWEAYTPQPMPEIALPKTVAALVVGAGYAGLSAARELARNGVEVLVLDSGEPGFGASTRSGGIVSGGANVGKGYLKKPLSPEDAKPFLNDAADAFSHIENFVTQEKINCGWHKTGYFLGAWCQSHFDGMAKKVELLNREAASDCYVVERSQQRAEIGSDYYCGGMVIGRVAHVHPALYFKGLLEKAVAEGAKIASRTPMTSLDQNPDGSWNVRTPRGLVKANNVIIATNGYTGKTTPQFQKRVVPLGSYLIATEELPEGMAQAILPRNRSIVDTRRVLTYYRLSPDGKRLIFGGRAKFGATDPMKTAPMLYRFMTDRFPELNGVKITHSWTGNVAFTIDELPHMGKFEGLHFALGCNGSGVAMMSYLGHQVARKVLSSSNRVCAFDRAEFPTHPLYNGSTWFLPYVGNYFRFRDWWDRRFN